MNQTNRLHPATWIAAALLALPLLLLALTARAGLPAATLAAPTAGADLIVQTVSLTPQNSNLGDNVTIHVVIKNQGDAATAGQVFVHIFTPKFPSGRQIGSIPSVGAGQTPAAFSLSRTDWFLANGCGQQVRAVVDKDNSVSEGDEGNNEQSVFVDIGPGCTPTAPPACTVDAYENDLPNPPTYAFATWIAEESTQDHSFCDPDTMSVDESDVVKFTVFSGLTYTLSASNFGSDAKAKITLYDGFGGTKLAESPLNGNSASFVPPFNGFVYAQIDNVSASSGLDTGYKLTLTTSSSLSDGYEPDDTCATARDITTNGVRQDHRFQKIGDEDWVKFSIAAGDSYVVITDQSGANVSPQVDVFAACNQVQSNNTVVSGAGQADGAANTNQLFYARISNQGNNFGASATYRVGVLASTCAADDLEEDDASAQASTLAPNGNKQSHNFCPAQDQDWVKINLQATKTYVLLTSDLAFAADTVLTLYSTDGTTKLVENDDYGYVSASRIVFQPTVSGTYFASVRHANPIANGPNTAYQFSVREGVCQPDSLEGDNGNNGPGDAPTVALNGSAQASNFCNDPLNLSLGDQDWLRFNAVAGGNYQILTSALGPNSDTVLELYGSDGETQLLNNDDIGQGLNARINFTPTVPGQYFVRVKQHNANVNGSDTDYNVQIFATEPPTPTPTPSPTPLPTSTPLPTAPPKPSNAETLILINKARFQSIYGASKANALMTKLFALADNGKVKGVVLQVESDPNVASAYAAWTANATTLADNDKANNVIAAVRNRLLSFLGNAPQAKQVIIVGDDRIIPFRRVLDRVAPTGQSNNSIEEKYALELSSAADNASVRGALAANMILTDDFLVDKEPSQWKDKQNNNYELYLPDFGTGRLIETPDEIMAFIDNFLGGDTNINVSPGNGKALVTGYDFVQDGADIIKVLLTNDSISTTTQIGLGWTDNSLRSLYLTANPRFDLYSINGHSTHITQNVPSGVGLTAAEVTTATTDLSGALIFSLGCHGGLNDPAVLDLPQAYARKFANYVGNTGFGWGGGGIVYSEALYRNYVREILRDTKANIGPALSAAKKKYYTQASTFNAYDAKILMQTTLYGLPMVEVNSGSTLVGEDPFPSADGSFTPPNFSDGVSQGAVGYELPNSFGAFGDDTSNRGQTFNLDGNVSFAAGEPLQPQFFADVSSPAAGELRGVVFTGGVYSETASFDPVVALADNEYVPDKTEPSFSSTDYYPALPFATRSIEGGDATVVMTLGQYKSDLTVNGAGFVSALANSGVNRIYDQMSFGTYYSNSPDRNAANIAFVDGVLNAAGNGGRLKVETSDGSGINRVLVAYDQGIGQWRSSDLTFELATQKWTGTITGTAGTKYFVQVVDNAGNVAINDNKGRYYTLAEAAPLGAGQFNFEESVFADCGEVAELQSGKVAK